MEVQDADKKEHFEAGRTLGIAVSKNPIYTAENIRPIANLVTKNMVQYAGFLEGFNSQRVEGFNQLKASIINGDLKAEDFPEIAGDLLCKK